jgi:hypothetical protein
MWPGKWVVWVEPEVRDSSPATCGSARNVASRVSCSVSSAADMKKRVVWVQQKMGCLIRFLVVVEMSRGGTRLPSSCLLLVADSSADLHSWPTVACSHSVHYFVDL